MATRFFTGENGSPNESTLKVEKGKEAIAGSQERVLAFEGQDAREEKGDRKEMWLKLRC